MLNARGDAYLSDFALAKGRISDVSQLIWKCDVKDAATAERAVSNFLQLRAFCENQLLHIFLPSEYVAVDFSNAPWDVYFVDVHRRETIFS